MKSQTDRFPGALRHNLQETIMKNVLFAALCAILASCGPIHHEWSCTNAGALGVVVTAETNDTAKAKCLAIAGSTTGNAECTTDADCDTAHGYTCNPAPALARADGSIPAVCTASCTINTTVCAQYGDVCVMETGGGRCRVNQQGGTCSTDCGASCATKCAAGHICTSGLDCQSNVCTGNVCTGNGGGGCQGALTQCGNACVNTASDTANCGGCGRVCGAGQICSSSTCVTQNGGPCGAGQIKLLDGTCVSINVACKDGGGNALPLILSCCNGNKDGNETCSDGGGSDCNSYYRCRFAGQGCRVNEDCNTNATANYPNGLFCSNGTCQAR